MNEASLKSLVGMVRKGTLLSAEGEAELVQGVEALLEEVERQRKAVGLLSIQLAERTTQLREARAQLEDQVEMKDEAQRIEREECAKTAEGIGSATTQSLSIARAIRARGGA